MPDDDQFHDPFHNGGIVIGMDGAAPDGPIVYATLDPQGRISQVRSINHAPDGHVVVGEVLPPGAAFPRYAETRRVLRASGSVHVGPVGSPEPVNLEDFDLGAYTDVGYTSSDGVSWTEADSAGASWTEPPNRPRFAVGGIVPSAERLAIVAEFDRVLMPAVHRRMAEQELAARVAAAPAPAGDVLDRIDAAVAELCACGCRKQVPPDGASAYFASPECQRRWHSAQATDAEAVYRRPDAASVYVGADHARVPLGGDPPEIPAVDQRVMRRVEPIDPCPDLFGAGYRRQCRQCAENVVPHYTQRGDYEVMEFGSGRVLRYEQPEVLMICPRCMRNLDGPLLFANVFEQQGHLVLELSDGQSRTRRRLRLTSLIGNVYRAGEVEGHWAHMERELSRFRRQWVGRTLAAERIGMSVMSPSASIRVTEV